MRAGRTILLAFLLIAGVLPLSAEDWPQFRGPAGQGHSSDPAPPIEWSETRNVAWKTPVDGSGWSSPVVAGGRVWLTAERSAGPARVSLRALAYDAASGRQLIDTEVFRIDTTRPVHPKNSRASPTPILDGDRVYVHFGADGTAALTTAGDILWTTTLPYESQHGNGGSPALYDDLLIVNCDGNGGEAYVVALETSTGRIRWKRDRPHPADQAYSTPLVIRAAGRDLVVSVGAYRVVAYDPRSGDEVWHVRHDGFSNVPRPVYGEGHVYIATGFNTPSLLAIRPDGRGDVTRTHVAWTLRRGAPYTPSPILVGRALYYVSDTGILTSADAASGRILWQARIGGNHSASPVFAGGHLYFLSEEGVTTVVSPGAAFERVAVNALDGRTLASIAVSDGSLFIRSDNHLYRIAQSR